MKLAICCINSKFIHASLAPWCLYYAIKDTALGIDATVIEATINANPDALTDKILSEKYDVVSFSCYIWNINHTLEICKKIKAKSTTKIILGGPEVSYRAKSVLNDSDYADFIISGEGEEPFADLISALNNNSDFTKINALTFRKDNKIISNAEKAHKQTPLFPYGDEYIEKLNGRISYIEASRGCPYSCAFCLSGRCSPLRYFDIEQTKKKIITLASSGSRTIKFVDRTFNASAQKCNEILSFILENLGNTIPNNICFHFEIAGDILKESTLNILKTAPVGLFQLEIGIQSFNEKTLNSINRKTDCKQLINNIKELISFGNMHIHIDLIAGLPHEDIDSLEKSFNTAYNLKANMLQLGFLKLLHGADMREKPDEYPCVYSDNPPYEVRSTPWLTESEISSLKNCEDALDRLYNSGRFLFTLNYLIDECNIQPFRLFYDFGNNVKVSKISLSEYAELVYNYFKDKVDSELLREAIICDLLSCSSALQIPHVLKRKDNAYKQIKRHFTDGCSEQIKIAVLYKSGRVFAVNQSKPKGFNGRYSGAFYKLSDFENIINKND